MALTLQLRTCFNFAATFSHPWAGQGFVEMIPSQWLQSIAVPNPKTYTDLTPGGVIVSVDALWEDMKAHGMRDPFIVAVGRQTRDCRLEAGNQRVGKFIENGEIFVPAVVMLADDCIICPANGDHRYQRDLLIPVQEYTTAPYVVQEMARPTAVFAELQTMKKAGLLPAMPQFILS